MSHNISYDNAVNPNNTITSPSTLTTTEADLFVIKDTKYTSKAQYDVYLSATLTGGATATFKYYVSPDGGTTWFPISVYNAATGELTQRNVLIDGNTYAKSGVSYGVDSITLNGTLAFKVTGLNSSGTLTYTVNVLGRDN